MSAERTGGLDLVAERRSRFRRIVLALDPIAPDAALLDAAARLAKRLQAELRAVFIEDIDVVRAAEHSFEVFSTLSASRQRIDMIVVEQAFRSQRSRTIRVFEEVSRRLSLHATFEIRRGRVPAEVLACGGPGDLVVVARSWGGYARRSGGSTLRAGAVARAVLEGTSCSVLILNPKPALEGPVLTAYDGSPAAESALLAAADLADRDGGNVVVALARRAGENLSAWRDDIAARLRARRLAGAFIEIRDGSLDDLVQAAQRYGVAAVVLSAGQELARGEGPAALQAALPCSMLLVR